MDLDKLRRNNWDPRLGLSVNKERETCQDLVNGEEREKALKC